MIHQVIMKKIFLVAIIFPSLFACKSEYMEIKESNNTSLKYIKGMQYFEEEKYDYAIDLLESVRPFYSSQSKGEIINYTLAKAYFIIQNYDLSAFYYEELIDIYPKTKYRELAMINIGTCYNIISPKSTRDQSYTESAIKAYQRYLETYPYTKVRDSINNIILTLEQKIEKKWYDIANLYYNLENYKAAYIAYDVFLTNYINSPYSYEIKLKKIKSGYILAMNSVYIKKKERIYNSIEDIQYFLKTSNIEKEDDKLELEEMLQNLEKEKEQFKI